MNKTSYKQYDTRWAGLGYPKRPWYIRNCGCGEVSICNVIIEMTKNAKQTPKTIRPYMVQYAEPHGNGTYHAGIPKAMTHYGLTEVKEHPTMAKLWAELKKGGRVAILLMGKKLAGTKKVRWTGSGHFVAAVGYKFKDGKHWLYIKDPATTSSLRNGWITYEGNIRGACLKVWSGKLPTEAKPQTKPQTKPKAPAKPKKPTNAQLIHAKAKEYAYPAGTGPKKWHYKTGAPKPVYKAALKKYMNKSSKVCQSDCGYFISTCVRAAGVDKNFNALKWDQKLPKNMKIVFKGKMIPAGVLQPGDIIRYKKTTKRKNGKYAQHVMMYYGNGYVAEAGREVRFPIIRKDTKRYNGKNIQHKTIQVIRAK